MQKSTVITLFRFNQRIFRRKIPQQLVTRHSSLIIFILLVWLLLTESLLALPQEAVDYWKKGRWQRSAQVMDQYISSHPKDFQALLFRAKIAYAQRELVLAQEILERAKKIQPSSAAIYYYLARVASARREYKRSFQLLQKADRLKPRWYKIHRQRAWLYVGQRRIDLAYQEGIKARKLAPKEASVHSTLGYIYFRKKKITQARFAFTKALKLDPLNRTANWYLGTGLGFPSSNRKLRSHPGDWKKIQDGLKCLNLGDFNQAQSLFQAVLAKYPSNSTCHFLLAETLRERDIPRRAIHYMKAYGDLSMVYFSPQISDGIIKKFYLYEGPLTEQEKKALYQASILWKAYLLPLAGKGIHHRLLPLERRISEFPSMNHLKNKYSQDGRRYGDVRGLTDKTAITGREALFNSRVFSFNTVAHELAHQVQMNGFSRKRKKQIYQLYRRALIENRCLDYYATSTVYEYFAQGYEAFISRFKRPGLGVTSYHTREELQRKDPRLYHFLKKITKPAYTPNQLAQIYYYIGKIYQGLREKKKARQAFEKAIYLALGMMDGD